LQGIERQAALADVHDLDAEGVGKSWVAIIALEVENQQRKLFPAGGIDQDADCLRLS
jgi:hypothetical protein